MRKLVVILALAIAGCATFERMDQGLNSLMGLPEQDVFSALGFPTGQQEIAGTKVYLWGSRSSGVMFMPTTSTTTGAVGGVPVYGTTQSSQLVPVDYECSVRVMFRDGVARSYDYEGNLGGCEGYIQRLDRYLKARGR